MFIVKVNIFKGITLPDAPKFGKVFGGASWTGKKNLALFLLLYFIPMQQFITVW